MARVTAYEASDGSLHRDKKLFKIHEQNLQAAAKIRDQIEKAFPASDGTPAGDAARAAAVDSHYNLIVNTLGLSELREILNTPVKGNGTDDDDGSAGGSETNTNTNTNANQNSDGGGTGAPADAAGAAGQGGAPASPGNQPDI